MTFGPPLRSETEAVLFLFGDDACSVLEAGSDVPIGRAGVAESSEVADAGEADRDLEPLSVIVLRLLNKAEKGKLRSEELWEA